MDIMQTMLKAPNITYANIVFKPDDPKELFIAINELSYHLSDESKNTYNACYWLEWIIEFCLTCKKNSEDCLSERRTFMCIEEKYKKDSIWIVWELFLNISKNKKCKITEKIIESLLDMFCLKFTTGTKRKRKYILYNCVSILNDATDVSMTIWDDINKILFVSQKINVIYKEIKKNEIFNDKFQPKIKNNLTKSIEKLEIMSNYSIVNKH
jgi:hypothetical protein